MSQKPLSTGHIKAGARGCQKSGPAVAGMFLATAIGGKLPRQVRRTPLEERGQHFFDLIFLVTFFIKEKSDYAPAAMSRPTFTKSTNHS